MRNVLLASAFILFINIGAQPQGAPQKPQTQPAETRPAGETPQGAQTTPRPGAPQTMDGYGAQNAQAERDWESRFRSIPSTDNLRAYMQRLSLHPHAVGQPYDEDNAEWILAKFEEWGWDAKIETFDVLFPTPRERALEMTEPARYAAHIQEPKLTIDPTTGQAAELPTYNAYSADGDVTAPLVYANYGLPEDYDYLDRLGISVKGAIVITRYGGGWRGIKPMVAAAHGAAGCLIYSDPAGDGYAEGAVFPNGAYRPKGGVQRGSVMQTFYPGDPLTPGWGSTPGARRISREQAGNLPKIPVMPIGYEDAQPLLAALAGPVAPERWRGALPITYRVGPGPAKVHLRLMHNWEQKTLYDVIARMPGSTNADQWIIRGNHHDAWVYGADDPISGLVAVLEEARALGELAKQGWRPKRTLIYTAWDGEEPGLLGSTEWAETHADELQQHAAMYVNSDSNSRGILGAGGSHVLEKLVNDVAREINDPEKNITLWKRSQLAGIARGKTPEVRQELRTRANWRIGALGDGSDYTAFADHLGIPSLSLGFGGEGGGGVYHSIYDDFYWYTHFADTKFVYARALAQMAGSTVMRMADADVLPYDFIGLADTVKKYADELQKLLKDKQTEAQERNTELQEGAYTAVDDPEQPLLAPKRLDPPPQISFTPLLNASATLTRSAERYQKAINAASQNGGVALAAEKTQQLNATLLRSERALLDTDGLPNRAWFKHVLYAPGIYTGYASKTIPGVREAIEEGRWAEAEAQMVHAAKAIEATAAVIEQAAQQVEGAR